MAQGTTPERLAALQKVRESEWEDVSPDEWQDVVPSKPVRSAQSIRQQSDLIEKARVAGGGDTYLGGEQPGSAGLRFLSGAAEMLDPRPLWEMAKHPVDALGGIVESHRKEYGKAADAFKQGRYVEAFGHGLAGNVPVVGPMAASIGEQAAQGDVAGAAGKAAVLLAPAGKAAGVKVAEKLHMKPGARSFNALMELNAKELEYGRNPGELLSREGVSAATKEGLLDRTKSMKKTAGQGIDLILNQDGAGKTIRDVDQLVQQPFVDATKGVGAGSESAFQSQLYERLKGIIRVADEHQIDLSKPLTPKEVNVLKQEVGKGMKWHGAPYEGEINQVLEQVYRNLNGAVEAAVPRIKAANKRWGELQSAENALDFAVRKKGVSPLGISGDSKSVLGQVLNKTVGSTMPTTWGNRVARDVSQSVPVYRPYLFGNQQR